MSLIRRALHALVGLLPAPRVIFDRAGTSPYLSRYYVTPGPRMPDGSSPWNATGGPREGIVWPQRELGVYLHRFHRGDDDQELHNHPWKWAVSFILAGGYREERRTKDDRVETRVVLPGDVNVIRGDDFHRVDLLEEDAWSLFIAGPKASSWGFWDRFSKGFLPWREFIAWKRSGGSN